MDLADKVSFFARRDCSVMLAMGEDPEANPGVVRCVRRLPLDMDGAWFLLDEDRLSGVLLQPHMHARCE